MGELGARLDANPARTLALFRTLRSHLDGHVTRDEFGTMLLHAGLPTADSELREVWAEVETGSDGFVEVSHLQRALQQPEEKLLGSMETASPPPSLPPSAAAPASASAAAPAAASAAAPAAAIGESGEVTCVPVSEEDLRALEHMYALARAQVRREAAAALGVGEAEYVSRYGEVSSSCDERGEGEDFSRPPLRRVTLYQMQAAYATILAQRGIAADGEKDLYGVLLNLALIPHRSE